MLKFRCFAVSLFQAWYHDMPNWSGDAMGFRILRQSIRDVKHRHHFLGFDCFALLSSHPSITGRRVCLGSQPELRDVVQNIAYTEVFVGSVSSGMMLCSSATRLHGGPGASQPRTTREALDSC